MRGTKAKAYLDRGRRQHIAVGGVGDVSAAEEDVALSSFLAQLSHHLCPSFFIPPTNSNATTASTYRSRRNCAAETGGTSGDNDS